MTEKFSLSPSNPIIPLAGARSKKIDYDQGKALFRQFAEIVGGGGGAESLFKQMDELRHDTELYGSTPQSRDELLEYVKSLNEIALREYGVTFSEMMMAEQSYLPSEDGIDPYEKKDGDVSTIGESVSFVESDYTSGDYPGDFMAIRNIATLLQHYRDYFDLDTLARKWAELYSWAVIVKENIWGENPQRRSAKARIIHAMHTFLTPLGCSEDPNNDFWNNRLVVSQVDQK